MPDEQEPPKGTDEKGTSESRPAERDADPKEDVKSAPTRGGSNVPNAGRDPEEHRNE
jgi:hypothetical protein